MTCVFYVQRNASMNMKSKHNRRIGYRVMVLAVVLAMLVQLPAFSDRVPYTAYGYDVEGNPFWLQTPYSPGEIIGQYLYVTDEAGELQPVKGLSNPMGMYVDKEDYIYIADRDNNRIVKIDAKGMLLGEYGISDDRSKRLKAPEGVFVTDNGDIYVADTGNARVVVFDGGGEIINVITAPDDPRLANMMFAPVSIAVDLRGYIFIALKSGNEGLLSLNPEGEFQGFFGRNATELTFTAKLKRFVFTEEQIAKDSNTVAASVSGVAVGRDGFIYTCTRNVKKGQVKKLNARAVDQFDNRDMSFNIPYYFDGPSEDIANSISSLCVDANGIIYATDRNNGAVMIYDSAGYPLVMFGAKAIASDRRIGVFSEPSGIAVSSTGTLYVLDRGYNGIHVFEPTTFMRSILTAVSLYNDGQYYAAKPYWESIQNVNVNYYRAYVGIGKTAYMDKDWKKSMELMKSGQNQEFYSDAQWQYRAEMVQKHASNVLYILCAALIIHFLLVKIFKFNIFALIKKGIAAFGKKCIRPLLSKIPPVERVLEQLHYSMQMIRHPIDTYYESVYRGRGSIASAAILYILFVVVMVLKSALTNFVFDKWGLRDVDLVSVMLFYVAPIALWTLANYLIGAITKGQGTMRGIFITTIYALVPVILCTVPLALISNLLTMAEASIYTIMQVVLYSWTGILLFLQVKEIHGYEIGETIRNIFFILFTIVIMLAGVFAIYGIVQQSYNFLGEFIRELVGYV